MPPQPEPAHPEQGAGLLAGAVAYLLWGVFPVFFAMLRPALPLEILAHRIVWSLVFVTVLLLALRHPWGWLRAAFAGRRGLALVAAAVFVAINWLTYIVAVLSGYVVEASLGYFINPLVNVALGVLLFGERVGRGARVGGLLALAGVVVIAAGNWRTLWISLVLAFSFGLYGAVKKRLTLPALEGLFAESLVLAPAAAGYLGVLAATGASHFTATPALPWLLALSGVLTATPLWLFAVAARRLPLGIVGMLQYIAPTCQFLLGITVFGQRVTPSYWAGLVLVWLGSAAYLRFTLAGRRSK